MSERIVTMRLMVNGMSCSHCEKTIESAVGGLDGVTKVTASAPLSEVMVYYDPQRAGRDQFVEAITRTGYTVREDPSPRQAPVAVTTRTERRDAPQRTALYRFLGLLAIIAAAYLIIRFSGGATFLPSVSQSMGYGLLFVVGLLTSLHCIAMCGGIVLSQGISREGGEGEPAQKPDLKSRLVPSLLLQCGPGRFLHGDRRRCGSARFPVQPLHGDERHHAPHRRSVSCCSSACGCWGYSPGSPASRCASRVSAGGRSPGRPRAADLSSWVCSTGSCRAARCRPCRSMPWAPAALRGRPLHAHLQRRHRPVAARFRRDQLPPQREVQPAHAQGERSPRHGARPRDVRARHEPLRGLAARPDPDSHRVPVAVATVSGDVQTVRTTIDSGQYHPFVVRRHPREVDDQRQG